VHVLVLGGTGFIGAAVVPALIRRGHTVIGLTRSAIAAETLRHAGGMPLAGDLAEPERWIANLPQLDAVIHAAGDVAAEMGAVDRRLLDVLLAKLAAQRHRPRFIYTGGCWLFGATGDDAATEQTPFSPLPAFAWMVPHLRRVLASRDVAGIVVHPAMVYTADGGVFSRFVRDARDRRPIRVVDSENTCWPLVHRDDLAELYALALEAAPAGSSYIGAAIDRFQVGRIARAFARRFALPDQTPQVVSADLVAAELGEWARGYARAQRLSGARAMAELGWRPVHLDVESEIAALG